MLVEFDPNKPVAGTMHFYGYFPYNIEFTNNGFIAGMGWHGRPALYGDRVVGMPMISHHDKSRYGFGMWDNQTDKTTSMHVAVLGY